MTNKICIVEWLDAWSNSSGYYSEEEDRCAPMPIVDVGFVAEENDEGILLATSACPKDGGLRHLLFIPRGMIQNIYEVDYEIKP